MFIDIVSYFPRSAVKITNQVLNYLPSNTGNYPSINKYRIGMFMIDGGVGYNTHIQLLASAYLYPFPALCSHIT